MTRYANSMKVWCADGGGDVKPYNTRDYGNYY